MTHSNSNTCIYSSRILWPSNLTAIHSGTVIVDDVATTNGGILYALSVGHLSTFALSSSKLFQILKNMTEYTEFQTKTSDLCES